MAGDASIQELCDQRNSATTAILSLLADTSWPTESKAAAESLQKTINDLPAVPPGTNFAPFKAKIVESIRVLEEVHTRLKEVSEIYGRKKIGFLGTIKDKLSSQRRRRCTDTLWGCRGEIENVSKTLRNYLNKVSTRDNIEPDPFHGPQTHPEPQPQLTSPLAGDGYSLKLLEASQTTQTEPTEQTFVLEHPISRRTSPLHLSLDPVEDGGKRSLTRDKALIAARKTFEAAETVLGAIPVVGDLAGVAAKVGLGFVNMIETMDRNQDVSKELVSHTSKLLECLGHFERALIVEEGDELIPQIKDWHRELESVQTKVKEWDSSGRLKKALLSADHAEELKTHQDKIQTALGQMQLLINLGTADLVAKLMAVQLGAERSRLLDRLGDGSYGAKGNAIEDVVCLPGTRVEILNRINQWIKDSSPSAERVLWIRGMAGRGKSTIASTVAEEWASRGSCAIFHFRRGQNELDGQFVCALARQLGKAGDLEVKNAILICVKQNEDIAKERLEQQFKTLFAGALGKLQYGEHPILIVVDALDECKNVNDAVRFVRLIGQHSTSFPANVKFLLTCRPEPPLILALELRKWRAEDLDSISHVDEDIKRFLQHAGEQIREEYELPQPWPSPNDLEVIVGMSQGLFQWARTAISYISKRSPENRLKELLQHPSKWAGLDELYDQILSRAFDEVERSSMRKEILSWALGTLVVAPYHVTLEVIAFLHADHEIFKGQANIVDFVRNDILADLNSLLHIPKLACEPVRLMHTSIRDLLTARERCESRRYFVDLVQDHRRLASVSLEIMRRDLKQDICTSTRVPRANSEIQDAINQYVTSGLRYCCRSWFTHLAAGIPSSEATDNQSGIVMDRFKLFSDENLLHWLEVMSLIGTMTEAYTIAKQVIQWLLERPGDIPDDSLNILWNDTQRFVAAFFKTLSFNAADIYASALPRSPVETKLWLKYRGQATSRILMGKRERNWSAAIWTASAASEVRAVAFSPDGSSLVSGSDGMGGAGAVQFWDTRTGAPLGEPLTGHSGWIRSVVLSPDSRVLASASFDKRVRLWDAMTGSLLCDPLTGHSDSITAVVFSPDGKVVASGSEDRTVRLWDAQTGIPLGEPLTGHTGWVMSVVFSPDGKVLASGSDDNTVRLWDAPTGAPLGDPLTGHENLIASVVFSPDGKILASGSDDKTIRLWDVLVRGPLGDPLDGHSKWITCLAFSPDGDTLASGSADTTVRLWNVQTGAPLGDPLTGHRRLITSVAFSPGGNVLASGSEDKTVRLWGAQGGVLSGEPLTGHSSWVKSVAFSPDGRFMASGSSDSTVRLWDAQTGTPLNDPLKGHDRLVRSVAFSPDGMVVASGSDDEKVQLWDLQTGTPLGDPLAGHSGPIRTVAFSPDGRALASGSDDRTVRLWYAQSRAPLGDPLTGHSSPITSLVFSPDSKVLASGGGDNIRLWDAQTGAPLGEPLVGHTSWIMSVVFSPDGKILASGSDDNTVRLWDAVTGAALSKPLTGHSHLIRSVVFSPDGRVLVSGSDDKTVRLWDVLIGAALGEPLTGHSRSITSVVFLPGGNILVSASLDGMIRFWDPLTYKLIHPYPTLQSLLT